MERKTLTRFLLVLILTCAAISASHAQPVIHTAMVQPFEAGTSPKAMFVALIDMLPGADVAHDGVHGTLTVVTPVTLSFEELQAIIEPKGFQLISLETN